MQRHLCKIVSRIVPLLLMYCPFMYSLFLMTKMLFAYSVFATYLLQFYVPLDFLEPPLYKRINLNNRPHIVQTLIQLGFRTFIVLITGKLDGTFLLVILYD